MIERGIGTYPVGLLHDIKHHTVKRGLNRLLETAKAGHWQEVRNYFNGYLAEWHYPPEMSMSRCGSGWTRRAAIRRLGKYIVRDNLSEHERVKG